MEDPKVAAVVKWLFDHFPERPLGELYMGSPDDTDNSDPEDDITLGFTDFEAAILVSDDSSEDSEFMDFSAELTPEPPKIGFFPPELWYMVRDYYLEDDDFYTLRALANTSKSLNAIMEPHLYRMDALRWAGVNGQPPAAPSALLYGAYLGITDVMERSIKAAKFLGLKINLDLQGKLPITEWRMRSPVPRGLGSALHFAALSGHYDAAKYLIKRGARMTLPAGRLCNCLAKALPTHISKDSSSWEDTDYAGWLPLHYALCQGHSSAAELLINSGAPGRMNVNEPTICAVHSAAVADHAPWIYEKIQDKVNENRVDWKASRRNANVPVIEWMCNHGAPLHYAVASGHKDEPDRGSGPIKTLVELGANIDISTRRLKTPLTMALHLGLWDTAWTLVSLGASLTPRGQPHSIFPAIWWDTHPYPSWISRSVHDPHQNPQRDTIEWIVNRGNITLNECFNFQGETPLTWTGKSAAFSHSHEWIIPVLLQLGASPNKWDAKCNTLLHELAGSIRADNDQYLYISLLRSIRFVLQNGGVGSLYIKNEKGQTPVDRVVQILLDDMNSNVIRTRCVGVLNIFTEFAVSRTKSIDLAFRVIQTVMIWMQTDMPIADSVVIHW